MCVFVRECAGFGARLLRLLLRLSDFTDCRAAAAGSVDAEGRVNKSSTSEAKCIEQPPNCAALAPPHTDRYRHTHVHLYMPVINLTVSLETCPSVTDVSAFYRCLPSTNVIQSLSTQQAA